MARLPFFLAVLVLVMTYAALATVEVEIDATADAAAEAPTEPRIIPPKEDLLKGKGPKGQDLNQAPLNIPSDQMTPEQRLVDWVIRDRGVVRAEIKVNEQGVRGLYASEDIKKGKKILIIPGSCSLPLGLYEHAAIHEMATFLIRQKFKNGPSRHGPMFATLPKHKEVWTHDVWPRSCCAVLNNHGYEKLAYASQEDTEMFYHGGKTYDGLTVQKAYNPSEDPKKKKYSLDDFRATVGIVRSRAIGKLKGGTFLIAVMDMANHNSSSTHVIKYHKPKVLTGQSGFSLTAGHDVKAGEEITISYGLMPPDMAFYHYGYLPTFDANDTIPLFAMDHREWDNSHQPGAYNYTDITLMGDYEDVEDEIDRLKEVLKKASKHRETLEAMMDHYMKECVSLKRGRAFYDQVERYKRLRIKSLKHELKRLKQWLADYKSKGRAKKDEL